MRRREIKIEKERGKKGEGDVQKNRGNDRKKRWREKTREKESRRE